MFMAKRKRLTSFLRLWNFGWWWKNMVFPLGNKVQGEKNTSFEFIHDDKALLSQRNTPHPGSLQYQILALLRNFHWVVRTQ
jgi:hypothetical protein